jgi:hypothetical protein
MVTDLDGEVALSSARSWIHECLSTHEHCSMEGISTLPSRLIDVGFEERSPSVKLYITDPNGECGAYSALSYCWGGPQPVTATKSSLDMLKSGIAITALPQTIQDAVEVTRRLGLRFVWIDALCIIQDCAKDKDTEIQKMGSIYKNATVTIAASVGSSAMDGFLRTVREPPEFSSFQFPMPDGTSEHISISAWHPLTPESPLDTRGWTYQERLLSPRMLQFSERELLWSCQTEPLQTITKSSVQYVVNLTRLPSQIFNDALRGGSWRTYKPRLGLWKGIVGSYTRRNLTFPEDRLNALAGVANELARIWNDEHLYGLWKGLSVPQQLLWAAQGRQYHPRSSRAPSWSWASLDVWVSFFGDFREDAKLLSIQDASGGCPAKITLSCKLLTEEAIPRASVAEYWDSSEEYPGKQIYYLLLEISETILSIEYWGLTVIRMPDGFFRRHGAFQCSPQSGMTNIWENAERQEVVLV